MRTVSSFLILLLLPACGPLTNESSNPGPEEKPSGTPSEVEAQRIVDRSIAWQGGAVLNQAEVTFAFREFQFRVLRNDGLFEYERSFQDSTGLHVRDVLSNEGLLREVDGQPVALDSTTYASAETAVNSVVYFALLPLPLNDPAARKRLLGSSVMEGRSYDEVEVTFQPEGGGRDHDDRFIYWFDQEDGSLDYLAYYFHVDDGGSRFREAVNVREVAGVQIADYLNFKSDEVTLESVESYDSLFQAGALEEVSSVELRDVTIRPLPGS